MWLGYLKRTLFGLTTFSKIYQKNCPYSTLLSTFEINQFLRLKKRYKLRVNPNIVHYTEAPGSNFTLCEWLQSAQVSHFNPFFFNTLLNRPARNKWHSYLCLWVNQNKITNKCHLSWKKFFFLKVTRIHHKETSAYWNFQLLILKMIITILYLLLKCIYLHPYPKVIRPDSKHMWLRVTIFISRNR